MNTHIILLTVLLLSHSTVLAYTNPIENQTIEVIDNDTWILPVSNTLFMGETR